VNNSIGTDIVCFALYTADNVAVDLGHCVFDCLVHATSFIADLRNIDRPARCATARLGSGS